MPERTRLERRNRFLVLLALLLFVVGVGLGAQRAPAPQTMTAQRIVLVDGAGNERAILSADQNGGMVTFRNREGEPRLRIGMNGDEAHVDTWDNAAKKWRNHVAWGLVPVR